MIEVAEMRYKADITAGALKLPESRLIADLLLRQVDAEGWKDAIVTKNVLQARNPATASRLTRLIRGRLETMGPDLWKLVRDGKGTRRHPCGLRRRREAQPAARRLPRDRRRRAVPAVQPRRCRTNCWPITSKAAGSVIPKCRSGTKRHAGGSGRRCSRCSPRRATSRTLAASSCKRSTSPIRCSIT